MIWVTRLNGSEVVVNADLIETVEATPDTVVTLVDGKKYVVHEDPREVIERVRQYRAAILDTLEQGPQVGLPARPPSERPEPPGAPAEASVYVLPTPTDDTR